MAPLGPPVVVPTHGGFAKEGGDLQGAPPHPGLPGSGSILPVHLVDALLEHRPEEAQPRRQNRLAELALPVQQRGLCFFQQGLDQSADFFLKCRLYGRIFF